MEVNLAEPLAEYIREELDVEVEIFKDQVCIYAPTSGTLHDGTRLSAYLGSMQILEDRIVFTIGGSPLSKETVMMMSFNLADPESFDRIFKKAKEFIISYSNISIIRGS